MGQSRKPEIFLLVVLSYFAWGLDAESRFWFEHLDAEDAVDLMNTAWMVFSSYYLFKHLQSWAFTKAREQTPWKVWAGLLTANALVCAYSLLWFWGYATWYYQVPLAETTFFSTNIPLTFIVLASWSALFYQRHYFQQVYAQKDRGVQSGDKSEKSPSVSFQVRKGNAVHQLPQKKIAAFIVHEKLVWAFTFESERFLTDYSLQELVEKLPSQVFFRINRQAIIARAAIGSFQPLSNQKLGLQLSDQVAWNEELTISKYTAPDFKKWVAIQPEI